MQGMALMRLARMVGLRQAELARYLGLAREQTNDWARGKRPIPSDHLPMLTKRVIEALEHALADPAGVSKAALAAVASEIFHENLQALGYPLYPTLRELLTQLVATSETFQAAADPTPYLDELKTLSGALNLVTDIMNQLILILGMLDCPELTFLLDPQEAHDADPHSLTATRPGHHGDAPSAYPGA